MPDTSFWIITAHCSATALSCESEAKINSASLASLTLRLSASSAARFASATTWAFASNCTWCDGFGENIPVKIARKPAKIARSTAATAVFFTDRPLSKTYFRLTSISSQRNEHCRLAVPPFEGYQSQTRGSGATFQNSTPPARELTARLRLAGIRWNVPCRNSRCSVKCDRASKRSLSG